MHARVTRLEGSGVQVDEAEAYVRDTILPAARELEGFKGVLSLADPAGGAGLTITLWESEEAMRESEERANRMRDDAAQALGGAVASVERYVVTVSEMA